MSNATTGFNQSAHSSPTQRSSMPMNTYSYAMVSSDGVIYTWDVNAGNQPIGVATEIHEKLKAQLIQAIDKAESYYKMLVENGIIKPEPTQEEVLNNALKELQESRAQNAKLAEMIAGLTDKIQVISSNIASNKSVNEETQDTPKFVDDVIKEDAKNPPVKMEQGNNRGNKR